MFVSATISVLLFAYAAGQMDEDPACKPVMPPHKEAECCTAPDFEDLGDGLTEFLRTCSDEAGFKRPPPPPPGPPGSGTPPPPPSAEEKAAHDSAHECADECLFKKLKLVNSAGELDSDALKAAAAKMYTGDWASVGSAMVEKCVASAKSSVGPSAKCKSGAAQMLKCISRTTFLSCPSSAWNASDDCTAAKTRLTKCPNAMVHVFLPKKKN